MELYCGIGRLVSGRGEKGAAVAAAEYLQAAYSDAAGFSPRNVRRMRDFYRAYENAPELMQRALRIGWTQNMVILEADLTMEVRAWYLRAAEQFKWSKTETAEKIASSAHSNFPLDSAEPLCYTDQEEMVQEQDHEKGKGNAPFCVSGEHLPQSDGRVCDEGTGEKGRTGKRVPHRVCCHQHRRNRKPGILRHSGSWQSAASTASATQPVSCGGKITGSSTY